MVRMQLSCFRMDVRFLCDNLDRRFKLFLLLYIRTMEHLLHRGFAGSVFGRIETSRCSADLLWNT